MTIETALYAMLGICLTVIGWLLVDTLRGLRDAIKELNISFKQTSDKVNNHETRIAILEQD